MIPRALHLPLHIEPRRSSLDHETSHASDFTHYRCAYKHLFSLSDFLGLRYEGAPFPFAGKASSSDVIIMGERTHASPPNIQPFWQVYRTGLSGCRCVSYRALSGNGTVFIRGATALRNTHGVRGCPVYPVHYTPSNCRRRQREERGPFDRYPGVFHSPRQVGCCDARARSA